MQALLEIVDIDSGCVKWEWVVRVFLWVGGVPVGTDWAVVWSAGFKHVVLLLHLCLTKDSIPILSLLSDFAGIVKLPTIYSEILDSPQMQFSVSVKRLNDKNVQLLDQEVEIEVAMAAVWGPLVPGM